jgi:3-hydroxyacyl-CoA dehydrogenase
MLLCQVLGMHFFTPTHLMRLVECVRGEASSEQAIATVTNAAKKMRKVNPHTSLYNFYFVWARAQNESEGKGMPLR